ncbi:hypothetical protein MTBGP_09740 [Moorella thermoacetica]|uniref:hypothetical protein n=1 Tax=Neomoorella thermoacetica TaxID=1525 RepID=UPI0030CC6ADC
MFGKSKLAEIVAAFQKKVSERRSKIETRIASLETEAKQISNKIEAVMKELVDYELAEDDAGQAKCQKVIRELQLELERVQGLIKAYQTELQKTGSDEKDLANIRAAAQKEREARLHKIKELVAERDSIEQQIKQLENRLAELEQEINITKTDQEAQTLMAIATFIDPRIQKLPHFEHKRYLELWINGQDEAMEQTLARHTRPEEPERRVTYLNQPEKIIHA